jgi:excisionase family DNA binding protein
MMARLVTEKEAAEYTGLELATFRAWVASGRLPGPISECGKFDLKAIDAALDRISGLGGPANALDAWRVKGGGRSARAS